MTPSEFLILKKMMEQQQQTLRSIRKHQSWWLDFGANIAGNAVYDGALWLLRRLMRL